MKIGGRYNWKNQPERLVYIGKVGNWHQFTKVGSNTVWCEVLTEDLHLLEETTDKSFISDFAKVMEAKMVIAASKGRHGWNDPQVCSTEDLQCMLREHVDKGDPVDVANFAMMLWARGEKTS